VPAARPAVAAPKRTASAVEMGARQREISVSEFFTKNRHLLGFDSPRKALLTCVKEAVDNALDACEEAGILPDVAIQVEAAADGVAPPPPSQATRFRISVTDNGPGIIRQQIPPIFAKLLYGSKFHRLRMSRGQQGIGISAAGMYGQLTTGKPVQIISRTSAKTPAHYFEVQIDTKKNQPLILEKKQIDWEVPRGTRVTLEVEGRYQKGRASVDEYIEQTIRIGDRLLFSCIDFYSCRNVPLPCRAFPAGSVPGTPTMSSIAVTVGGPSSTKTGTISPSWTCSPRPRPSIPSRSLASV
jgi:DNA topoisomerase-6 subunit B